LKQQGVILEKKAAFKVPCVGLKNRRASSGLVNSGTNRTVATRFTRFAYSSFVTEERVEGSVLLDFFVTFFIKKESFNAKKNTNHFFVR
jgi:hypothetical protein